MNEFDEGVILRACGRTGSGPKWPGTDTGSSAATTWTARTIARTGGNVVPSSRKVSTGGDRSGPGFRTVAEAADEAVRLAGERVAPTRGRADPGWGGATLYQLGPRGRDLGTAVLGLRSGSKGDREALDSHGMDHGHRR